MAFTHGQQKALSIIPHFTGFLSFCGSGWIIYEVIKDRKKWGRTYHRLMLGMSTFDLFQSVANGLSTIPIPRGTEGVYSPMGTTATCTAQGFFVQLGLTSSFYNGMLALYYFLLIRSGMPERKIMRIYEPFMHTTALLTNFAFTFTGVGLKLYNNANLWCWIGTYPGNCQGSSGEPGPVPCERGYNAWIFRWAFFFAPLWFIMLVTSVLMLLLYRSVRTQEAKMIKYQTAPAAGSPSSTHMKQKVNTDRRFRRTKKVAHQALFYIGAFYLTWFFGTANRLQQLVSDDPVFGLMLMHCIFVPMQGALNFMVYMRPRYIRWRKKRRNERIMKLRQRAEAIAETQNVSGQENVANAEETGEQEKAPDAGGVEVAPTSNHPTRPNHFGERATNMMNSISLWRRPTRHLGNDGLSRLRLSTILDASAYDREFEALSDDGDSVDSGVHHHNSAPPERQTEKVSTSMISSSSAPVYGSEQATSTKKVRRITIAAFDASVSR